MNMQVSEVDWRDGQITSWSMDTVDLARGFEAQVDELTEDLAQVSYPSGKIIDVGWYPSMSEEGAFVVTVVSNEDWESPISRVRCASAFELLQAIDDAIIVVDIRIVHDRRVVVDVSDAVARYDHPAIIAVKEAV